MLSTRFSDGAKGSLELCTICASTISGSGIEVSGGSDPNITGCTIKDGQVGVSYFENGHGKSDFFILTI